MPVTVARPKHSFISYFIPIALLGGMAAYLIYVLPRTTNAHRLTEDETKYFESIYRDTWNYLAAFVEKKTGLPYDSSAEQPPTSMSNVGLYLTAVAVAARTELISKEEGLSRAQKCLQSLEQIETWRGFPRPWVIVRNLKPTFGDEFDYGPHLTNLIGGIVVTKTTFPSLAAQIDRLLAKWEFKSLYETRNGWLKGGYNVKTKNFALYQPWGHWYYKYFASEIRLLSFYLIARKAAPRKHWFALVRTVEKREGESFFVSSEHDGGMGPQYLPGIYLDERETEMGRSQKNLAQHQMKHAKKIGAPVWGWSPAQAPNGQYLVGGELRDEIVAPYASVLSVIYFPKQVFENLKKLEKLGARPAGTKENAEAWGFLDSVNWKTGSAARHHLTPSQGMIFLSLANLLYDGIVWKSFAEDPVVKQGLQTL